MMARVKANVDPFECFPGEAMSTCYVDSKHITFSVHIIYKLGNLKSDHVMHLNVYCYVIVILLINLIFFCCREFQFFPCRENRDSNINLHQF